MSPRTRHALIVAVAAVGIAAVSGIAAIQGWLPDWLSGDTPTSVETAPPDSLSPGESVVTADAASAKPLPAPAPAAPAPPAAPDPPPRKAAPTDAAPAPPPPPPPRRTCPHCGTVSSTAFHEREARNARWEVRVRFDDGTRAILRYPTNPGYRVGDRVALTQGRLRRE